MIPRAVTSAIEQAEIYAIMDEKNNKYVRADPHCAWTVRGIEHKMKVENRDIIERRTLKLLCTYWKRFSMKMFGMETMLKQGNCI